MGARQRGHAEKHHPAAHHPAPAHWREVHDTATGRLLRCRPAGAPAGAWPHTPWWHCVLHDPYERINFWSHAVPAVAFCAVAAATGDATLALFAVCAAVTHACSAATHVWPDSSAIEKADHLGITATIVGTPVSALMAAQHGHAPPGLVAAAAGIVAAAFLPPRPRVAGFVAGAGAMVGLYGRALWSGVFGAQLALYGAGAALFLRNGGHRRGWGAFTDHHLLHYFVTAASTLHLWDLWRRAGAPPGADVGGWARAAGAVAAPQGGCNRGA